MLKTRIWGLPLVCLLSLFISGVGSAEDERRYGHRHDYLEEKSYDHSENSSNKSGPLVRALRESLINSYQDSPPPGYAPDSFCASGADGGAEGIWFLNFSLLDGELNPAEPEVLFYEPLPGGNIRLVGAQYVYISPEAAGPVLVEGHLLHRMDEPGRYGAPITWFRLNAWAWEQNPNGTFASFNPNVSCDAYDPNLHPQPQPEPL